MKKRSRGSGRERGQTVFEYAATLTMFALVAIVMVMLLDSFSQYGWRILSLVGMEYP